MLYETMSASEQKTCGDTAWTKIKSESYNNRLTQLLSCIDVETGLKLSDKTTSLSCG